MFGSSQILALNVKQFDGEPRIRKTVLRPVEYEWHCPVAKCTGYMIHTSLAYSPPGSAGIHYAHKCDACSNMLSIKDHKFPRTEFEPV